MEQAASAEENIAGVVKDLKEMDWTYPDNFEKVSQNLAILDVILGAQVLEIQNNVNSLTGGMDIASYEAMVNSTLGQINSGLVQVDDGLKEVEKGELTAALEFANANLEIALGEFKMESAKAQLDAALEQLESGKEQLEDAKKQLEEGEKQLEDARKEAYSGADMTEIITVEMMKGLLTAQNFSMPAGYVTEDGDDYLVRIGDKPQNVEEMKALPLLNLKMDGVDIITLEDVADVFYTDNSAEIYANVNGSIGCMLTIQKQTGYSTGAVSDLLADRFEELMESEKGLTILTLMDQGIYIDLVMDSIINNVLLGGALAILILILFLRDITLRHMMVQLLLITTFSATLMVMERLVFPTCL